MMDEQVSHYFNAILADVEWQNGLTPSQREIALGFAQSWILDGLNQSGDVVRAYTNVREALRRLATLYRGETFVLTRGASSVVVEK